MSTDPVKTAMLPKEAKQAAAFMRAKAAELRRLADSLDANAEMLEDAAS